MTVKQIKVGVSPIKKGIHGQQNKMQQRKSCLLLRSTRSNLVSQ